MRIKNVSISIHSYSTDTIRANIIKSQISIVSISFPLNAIWTGYIYICTFVIEPYDFRKISFSLCNLTI